MPLQSYNAARIDFERGLERVCPTRVTLVRANPYTCTTCVNQDSLLTTCPDCNGTGYTGMARGGDLTQPPASTRYRIYADIQVGKGMISIAGGNFVLSDTDLGKINIGDATMFTKLCEFDRKSGAAVYPMADSGQVRPDRIIDAFGTVFTVDKDLEMNVGDTRICRAFTLLLGKQGAVK